MGFRSRAHWIVGASCFALIQGGVVQGTLIQENPAYAQPKSSGPEKPAKPALPKALQEVSVCARPRELHNYEYTWGYDGKGKLISSNVKQAVQAAGTTVVYVFNSNASRTSVDQLPAPHNDLRCPGDQRPPTPQPEAAPPPPPTSIRELLSTPAPKKGELPERVQRFCSWAQDFRTQETADGKLAMTFATKLRMAIVDDEAMGIVTPNDLSIEAAGILFGYFREKIIAALIYKRVIAPHNVQRKFMEFVGDPQWRLFPLLSDQWVTTSGIGTTNTAPTVILKEAVFGEVNKSLSAQMANVKTLADANDAYVKAYADVSFWLEAIGPYFAAKPTPVNAPVNVSVNVSVNVPVAGSAAE